MGRDFYCWQNKAGFPLALSFPSIIKADYNLMDSPSENLSAYKQGLQNPGLTPRGLSRKESVWTCAARQHWILITAGWR